VLIRAVDPANLKRVAEPLGRNQSSRAAAFDDQGVGRDGRTVHKHVNLAARNPGFPSGVENARHHVARGGWRFVGADLAGHIVDPDDVRKGAADIGCNTNHVVVPPDGLVARR